MPGGAKSRQESDGELIGRVRKGETRCLASIVARRGAGTRVHPGWRKLAAACLSVIPGAGHMFLGLIGKGFALMGLLVVTLHALRPVPELCSL